ncbi:MAG: neutral/alkaline non-lysosomal ceramidase N-terminal domain-containing protein, partial [Kiritimatiellae bacterium]|nr:neutral/alkaline non-lysosomal ceramidase N-terminal domain-containing protein [Kiritimatiellia bacterium]
MMKAGFAEIDITPPPGTKKGGWMEDLEAKTFLDPLFARVAIFQDESGGKAAFIQLDTLSVRWSDTDGLRKMIAAECGFPAGNIMVSATHNHAGPAIARLAPVEKETAYVEDLKKKCISAFTQALAGLEEAEAGFASVKEFEVAFNRRTVMRDGTVKSQTYFTTNPDALYTEGPVDPEVAVVMVRNKSGKIPGALVNFACHPTHHGGTHEISAGFPGVLAAKMKAWSCPVTLFLNGAYGNVTTSDYQHGTSLSKKEAGERLFADVKKAFEQMAFRTDFSVAASSRTIILPFRDITDDEYHGRVRGAQRFRSNALYEKDIDLLKAKIARQGTQPAEVQVIRLGDWHFAGIPAEYFIEHQLRIKTDTFPKHSFV